MITDALIAAAQWVVVTLVGLLPDAVGSLSVPSGSSVVSSLGGWAGPFDRYAPLSEACTMIEFVIIYMFPTALVYTIAVYVWARIPFIGS